MRVALVVLAAVAAVVAGGVALRDQDDDNPAPVHRPSGLGSVADTPDGLDAVLSSGNVVIETAFRSDVPILEAMARRVMRQAWSPALRRVGRSVEVRRSASAAQVTVYAKDRELVVDSASDPRIEAFVRQWLGRANPPPVHVTCSMGGEGTTDVKAARDVAFGPLVILGARLTVRHGLEAFNRHGYKLPVTLPHGMSATLSVPNGLRSHVGLVFTHGAQARASRDGVSGADSEVRFTACGTPGRTGWPGGLVVDRRRCAVLVVRVAGAEALRRRVPLGRRCQ